MDPRNIIYVITLNQTPKAVTLVPHDPVSRYKTQQLQLQNGNNRFLFLQVASARFCETV